MTRLWLGISAKVSVLVSRLHPKNLISKAYANYTKTDKAEGLVVVSEGPKLICWEEKVVVVFRHPPKGELTEEFECWAIHHFAHVTEEGNQEDIFMTSNDGGSNNSGGVGVAQPNPNITQNPTQHNPEDAQTNEAVPTEVVHLFESTLLHWTPTMQTLSAKYSLVWLTTTINHCQRIFQHQPKKDRMPHNSSPHGSILVIAIALLLEVANTRHVSASTQTSSQQSNNCSRCFSSSNMLKGSSSLKPTYACDKKNIVLSVMESSFIGLACGSSWQQSTVQIALIFGPWVRLIVLLVPR